METSAAVTELSKVVGEWGPILEVATQEVFQMMLGCSLEPFAESVRSQLEVTAVVGLAGQLRGAFSIRCSGRAAILMTSAMLGIEEHEVTEESWDAVGEVCNMTAGNFKAKLEGLGDNCMLSVPTIVSGADYTLRSLADGGSVLRDFSFKGEQVSVCLEVHT
jgi:chemotaxis protein CheX